MGEDLEIVPRREPNTVTDLNLVYWGRIVSHHIIYLLEAFSEFGGKVTYVAETELSAKRLQDGWSVPECGSVNVVVDPTANCVNELIDGAPGVTVHIVQGVRGGGALMKKVRRRLHRCKCRWGVAMETIRVDSAIESLLKSISYRFAFATLKPDFVLAIGENTPHWLRRAGVSARVIHQFAYFIKLLAREQGGSLQHVPGSFRVGMVGNLNVNKRPDLLLSAMKGISGKFELLFIGDGPSRGSLDCLKNEVGPEVDVRFLGALSIEETHEVIGSLDCLVLASDHDGWGVVANEALMSGVPVICSSGCGCSEVVKVSPFGKIFRRGSADDLRDRLLELRKERESGKPISRAMVLDWAHCLSPYSGAKYLNEILLYLNGSLDKPSPPWVTPFDNC